MMWLRLVSIIETLLSVGFMIGLMVRTELFMLRNPDMKKWRWHIIGMGVPYCLFALGAAEELRLRLHSPFAWRTPLYLAAATIGFLAQAVMWILWRRRERNHVTREEYHA